MNITPQVPNLSIPTVLNPHTESLRRENNQRDMITQAPATSQSTAEKGLASDKERGRTPAQNNATIDFANISEQAKLANSSITEQHEHQGHEHQGDTSGSKPSAQEASDSNTAKDGSERTRSEQLEHERVISELKKRDSEVRTHEAAHAAVGGSVTGAPSLSYTTGPDGKRYAVEGEVSVDLSIVKGDPQATIAKMQKVHAAALAPVHPSIQDTRVASTATQLIMQAQSELLVELAAKRAEGRTSSSDKENEQGTASSAVSSRHSSHSYEVLINKSLDNQESAIPSQPAAVVQRALRIENYYAGITRAYEKAPSFKFELTA